MVKVGLLERGNDSALGGGADDGHGVALVLKLLQLLGDARTLNSLLTELLGDRAELARHEVIDVLVTHGEAVLLLQTVEHAAEVVADVVLEQLGTGVVRRVLDIVLLHHLVGEVGAGLESKMLRLDERVVAVEHDVLDLRRRLVPGGVAAAARAYLPHGCGDVCMWGCWIVWVEDRRLTCDRCERVVAGDCSVVGKLRLESWEKSWEVNK